MNVDFLNAIDEITKEKGINKDVIYEALESALISSYKKNFGTSQNAVVEIDKKTGEIKVYAEIKVVYEPEDPLLEISLASAKKIDPNYEIDDIIRKEITPAKFGRIAAQTAKQVVIQKIKDAERDIIYDDYSEKQNELITGVIQRLSKNVVYVDLGKIEAILPLSEQVQSDEYIPGNRMKFYVLEVKKTSKGPQIVLSRSHPSLVKRLFELEVPEIQEGIVDVFSIAREAGSRTKIAVFSKDPELDPLGACVGYKGSRVRAIVEELNDEKIDIIVWDKKIRNFIANALSPSKVVEVIADEKNKSAMVIVPNFQLSLAIGKEGQNARLAAKLTNWKIDIKSETQFDEYYDSLTEEEQSTFDDMINRVNEFEGDIINTEFLKSINIENTSDLENLYSEEENSEDLEQEELSED